MLNDVVDIEGHGSVNGFSFPGRHGRYDNSLLSIAPENIASFMAACIILCAGGKKRYGEENTQGGFHRVYY